MSRDGTLGLATVGIDHGNIFMRVEGVQRMDCANEPLDCFRQFVDDVKHCTETAMTQDHVFEVCRLSREAQANATRITANWDRPPRRQMRKDWT